jgi:hypothetical protein
MKVRQAHGGDAEVIARLLGELGYRKELAAT